LRRSWTNKQGKFTENPSSLKGLPGDLEASFGHVDRDACRRLETEDLMLKHLSISAALMAFTMGSANAQQKEAVLQKVEVPGAALDIILAMPKPQGVTFDLSESPDALLVHLIGGELALAFDDAEKMLKALDSLRRPIGAFHVESPDRRSRIPIAVYLVPAGE
jgi:hypothetical protein